MADATPDDDAELTAWEARQERIARRALVNALKELGLDAQRDPLEIQQDMAWVRKRRKLEENTIIKTIGIILGVVIPAAIGSLAYGVQRYFGQ